MSCYLRADLAGCPSSSRIALSIKAVFVGHNQVCASCEVADLRNTLSFLCWGILCNTSCYEEHFNFKLHFPGDVTDHVFLGSHIPSEETRQDMGSRLTDASALHGVVVSFQPIRALFKALSTV